MTGLFLIAALGVGYAIYQNTKTREELQKEIEEQNRQMYNDIQQQIKEGTVTPDAVADGIDVDRVMIGFSSISDRYWNCAAGVVWKNTTNEAINLRVDSATFEVAGYKMKVGAKDLKTITVPAKSEIYQQLFAYENQTLFDTIDERRQVRVLIGTAQGHAGKEAKDIWGKVNFDATFICTYSTVGTLSNVTGKQGVIEGEGAIARYYGSTALKSNLIKWVRTYIWK